MLIFSSESERKILPKGQLEKESCSHFQKFGTENLFVDILSFPRCYILGNALTLI
jgi:hypothetical protein